MGGEKKEGKRKGREEGGADKRWEEGGGKEKERAWLFGPTKSWSKALERGFLERGRAGEQR